MAVSEATPAHSHWQDDRLTVGNATIDVERHLRATMRLYRRERRETQRMGFICHGRGRSSSAPIHAETAEALPRLYKTLLFNTSRDKCR
jgi:hypothetical protein